MRAVVVELGPFTVVLLEEDGRLLVDVRVPDTSGRVLPVGVAFQTGVPRIPAAAIEEAIGINGVGRRQRRRVPLGALRALGRRRKNGFGPRSHGTLRALARLKFLRGTPFDVFGRAHVRRVERSLLAHYVDLVTALVGGLTPETYERAVRVAGLPETVRGYEGIKLASVGRYELALRAEGVDTTALVL